MSKNLTNSSNIKVVTNGNDVSLDFVNDIYEETEVDELLTRKVNTEENKGLSTNDYTNEEKNKLTGIENGAEVNSLESISVDGTTIVPDENKNANIDLSGKVDVEEGKGLSSNDYTSTEKTKLSGINEGAEVNVLEQVTFNGTPLTPDENKNVDIDIDISGKVDKVEGKDLSTNDYTNEEKNKLTGIENGANNYSLPIGSSSVIGGFKVGQNLSVAPDGTLNAEVSTMTKYGVRRKRTSNSSSAWERLDDNENLVAQATKDGSAVTNDFNSIYPWSDIKSYNYNTENEEITAWIGDTNFKFDGTNGEVLTYIPDFYYRRYVENDYEYIYISGYPMAGYTKSNAFSIGRYKMSEADSKGHSISGANVSTNKNITQHRNLARALGIDFGQLDWRYFLIQMLYLVEYADYNSQSKLGNGITNMSYSANTVALKSESSVNRIIISSSYASSFIVGQQIDIGTSLGGRQLATYRTITAINSYDDGTITGTEIIFDGTALNIAIGNIIYSCGQNGGGCDILGMLSGCLNNDGKHSIIYRGIEDIFGNVFEWIDGLNIKDHKSFINYNPETYAVDKFTIEEGYAELGYLNAETDGYAKSIGCDANHPLVAIPEEVGGSNSTYMCDYYYQASGNRVACVGGYYNGTGYAGLWYWHCYNASSNSNINRGARLLRYQ